MHYLSRLLQVKVEVRVEPELISWLIADSAVWQILRKRIGIRASIGILDPSSRRYLRGLTVVLFSS